MPKKKALKVEDPVAMLVAGLKESKKKPNNNLYKPHPKQMVFHTSIKKGKQYIGGNRSGKTTGGINEDIWWLKGQHPYRKVPEPPVIGRITTVDFQNGANKIIIPNLRQWVPPSLLINGSWEESYNGQKHVLTLDNDSELEIMSYDQDLDKFAGVPRHFTHFDEEPPLDIYKECVARLTDFGGSWWMTMTPIEGMTWTYDQIFEPSIQGGNPLIDVIQVNVRDNVYLDEEAISDILEGYSEQEREIRGSGLYVVISGKVFQHHDPDKHIIPAQVPPREWTHYISLDAGFSNPTAVLWHAVSPTGEVVTYDEHYKSEWTVTQHADFIKQKEAYYRANYGIIPFLRIADPAITQRQQTTGLSIQIEYSQQGLNFALGAQRNVNAGLDKMNDYQRLMKWFITENCPNLQREMRTYARAQYATSKLREKNNKKEEPQKKNDHAIDSTRYFFSYMPDLEITLPSTSKGLTKDDVAAMLQPGTTYNPAVPERVDGNLQTAPYPTVITDEYVGEW